MSSAIHLPGVEPEAGTRQPVRADIHNQDCIAGMAERLSSSSVHLTVTSIPFEEL
jgi:hypothetical protein